MATFHGYATIYGADGTVTIAGTARGNLGKSMDVSRPFDHIVKLTDKDGKRAGYIVPEDVKEITVVITPGAATLAGVAAACALPSALATMVISAADYASVEGTYVLDKSIGAKISQTDPIELTVSGTQYTDATQTAAVAAVISS